MSSKMLKIGKYNQLTVVDQSPVGFILAESSTRDEASAQTALLPMSELSANEDEQPSIGTELRVFIYYSSTNDLLASMLDVPFEVDEYALLTSTGSANAGAFFDWKLPRDLLVPKALQHKPLDTGLSYVVRLIHDEERQKLIGSTKLHRFLIETGDYFEEGQQVDLMIFDKTNLGYKAIVNGTHQGLLFHSDLFKGLAIGEKTKGFIKQIREDGKINLILQQTGKQSIKSLSDQILDDLEAHGGISTLTDKSPSAEIQARFDVSKNAYKKALGTLYKTKRIKIEKTHISLITK